MPHPHILVFDPYAGGHHGQYVQMLLTYWVEHKASGCLDLVLAPDFASIFPSVARYAATHADMGIRLSFLPSETDAGRPSVVNLIRQDLANGRLVAEAIRNRRPDHCLLMYVDHAQLSLWKDLRFEFPVSISGIYFRPSFHYASLGSPPTSLRERLNRYRKRVVLAGALKNPHVTTVFSLDPFAVPYVNELAGRDAAVALPDGVSFEDDQAVNGGGPASGGDTGKRRTALLFGSLDERKGVAAVLEAVELLSADMQKRLRLTLAGPVSSHERQRIYAAVERARMRTNVEISLEDAYIPTDHVQARVARADFVLVTYQRHVGSSNVLVRAAAARTPVLGSDFGVVGEQIRRHSLGLAVDATSRDEIARGLERFVDFPLSIPFDEASAQRFAGANTAEAFAETIFTRFLEDDAAGHKSA